MSLVTNDAMNNHESKIKPALCNVRAIWCYATL